jgi:hypothetical protein
MGHYCLPYQINLKFLHRSGCATTTLANGINKKAKANNDATNIPLTSAKGNDYTAEVRFSIPLKIPRSKHQPERNKTMRRYIAGDV